MDYKQERFTIVFCLSPTEAPWSLRIIESLTTERWIVVTNNERIKKLFGELYDEGHIILTDGVIVPIFRKNVILLAFQIYKFLVHKHRFKNQFKKFRGANVCFVFVAFGLFESFLIKVLSRNNNIYYKPLVKLDSFKIDTSLKSTLNKFLYKLLLNISISPLKSSTIEIPAVSETFLRQIEVKEFQLPDNMESVNSKLINKYQIPNRKVLILAGFADSIDKEDYLPKMNLLIGLLVNKFGLNNIAIKWHPDYLQNYSFEYDLYEIPQYLPGNLLFDHFDIICGHNSAFLFEAANHNITAISTIGYCNKSTHDDSYKDYLANNLNKGKEIIFFDSLETLEKIV